MKNFLTFILITFLPLFSFAQQEVIDALVADFQRNKALSLDYLQAMPEDQYSYKPTDSVRSFAQQFLHASQGLIGLSANGTGAERMYPGLNLEKDESLQSKVEVTRIVTESFDYAIKSVQNMDPAVFNEIVERGPFKVTRIGWINKSLEHVVHHRGQCVIYLRMSGITPPQFKLFQN